MVIFHQTMTMRSWLTSIGEHELQSRHYKKLDAVSYLFWKSQVEPVIHSHRLLHFIQNVQIMFATITDRDAGCVTEAYRA